MVLIFARAPKRCAASLAVLFSCATSSVCAQADSAQPLSAFLLAPELDPNAFVRAVLAVNPSLEIARQSARAAQARERQSGQLADPMVHASLAPLSVAPSHHRLGVEVGLSQELPWFGRLGLEQRAMQAEAQAMQLDVDTARRELASSARLLYDQYYVVVRSQEINAQHLVLVRALGEIAAAQLSDSRGSAQDALQAEAQLAQLEREALMLASEREVAVAQLNELLHRAPDAPLPPPLSVLRRSERVADQSASASPLRAADQRSEIRAATQRARSESLKAEAAERAYYPSLRVSTSYSTMWDMPAHRFMVGVDVHVPWPTAAKSSAIDESRAQAARYQSEIVQLTDAARTEVYVAARRLREAEDTLALVETRSLVIASKQIEVARAAFMASRATFSSVLEAERSLRSVELERELLRVECDRREIALQRALGQTPGLAEQEVKP